MWWNLPTIQYYESCRSSWDYHFALRGHHTHSNSQPHRDFVDLKSKNFFLHLWAAITHHDWSLNKLQHMCQFKIHKMQSFDTFQVNSTLLTRRNLSKKKHSRDSSRVRSVDGKKEVILRRWLCCCAAIWDGLNSQFIQQEVTGYGQCQTVWSDGIQKIVFNVIFSRFFPPFLHSPAAAVDPCRAAPLKDNR